MRQHNIGRGAALRTSLVMVSLAVLHACAQPLAAQTIGPTLGQPPHQTLHPGSGEETQVAATAQSPSVLPIDTLDWQKVLAAYREHYLPAQPANGWTGNVANCNAGTTSEAFRAAVIERVNFFRAMAGVPADVTLLPDYNAKAQQAALMMSANNSLDHNPPATWHCFTQAGANAAGQGNLAIGAYGPDAINLYMREPGNPFAGHRRWLLYPQTRHMGTGDIGHQGGRAANSLRVFDDFMWAARPATRDEFVAWPPRGYVPQPLVYARWTFSLAGADFSAAQVNMQSQGINVPVALATQANGLGENTLVWIPMGLKDDANWPAPAGGTQAYQVSVSNVMLEGQPRHFTYTVTVVDPDVTPVVPPGEIEISGPGFIGTSFPANSTVAFLGPSNPALASQFSYALGSGTGDGDNTKFKIDGNALKTRVTLAELGKIYSVRVEATDGTGAKTADVISLPTVPTTNLMIPAVSGER